ncbi:hypothetical protein [Clostridium butyricum]|uniref:Uncharacterized protein n=2 Tax=Clostridium butyricum TaxID=1492 RepID=C4IFF1_CLOBU|nr:hypothetical protein [Clostridium butyricum]EEP53787.1 hypothetical protein CLP_1655 [Clostridium butyricum E4 str. BoNT E BL5262]NFL32861.1 hypothetical protein [Clostridium butyricum]NFS20235.1 hypothetical protein [Clostridium butyricum]
MGFEFKKNDLEIKIAGNVFPIDYNEDFQNRCLEFSKKTMAMAEEIGNSSNDAEAVSKTCKYCKEATNTLLGDEKASEKIFANRQEKLTDCIDVISYIFEEVERYKNTEVNKIKNFAKKHTNSNNPQNRQQKRYGKKNR